MNKTLSKLQSEAVKKNEEPSIKILTLSEEIIEILNSKWNQEWCPFCGFKGEPRQVIHHIISMHREKYDKYLTIQAKLETLISDQIQKAYKAGIKEVLRNVEYNAQTKIWDIPEEKLLSIQSKGK